jgi:hypothetical protein
MGSSRWMSCGLVVAGARENGAGPDDAGESDESAPSQPIRLVVVTHE